MSAVRAQKSPRAGARKPKVLVVDDSEIVRETVVDLLGSRGYDVVTLENPFLLTEMLAREHPDLVLVDVMMPTITGDKLVEVARSNPTHDCLLVLFSDKNVEQLSRLATACGAAGSIKKTGDGDELARLVGDFLQRRR